MSKRGNPLNGYMVSSEKDLSKDYVKTQNPRKGTCVGLATSNNADGTILGLPND